MTRGNRGIGEPANSGHRSWPCPALPCRGGGAPALGFTLAVPSAPAPGAPQTGLRPHAQPQQAARQTAALTCASRRGRQPLFPSRRFTPFCRKKPGSGRRAAVHRPPTVAAGSKAAYMIDAASPFPPGLRPLFLLPSNPQLSRTPAPPPPGPPDAPIRGSGRGSPAQIESSSTIWSRSGCPSLPRSESDCAREHLACQVTRRVQAGRRLPYGFEYVGTHNM